MEDGIEQNRSIQLEMMDRKKANQGTIDSKPKISKLEISKPIPSVPLKKEENKV